MSRIGKKAIEIPDKVKMAVSEDGSIQIEGPKGRLEWVLPGQIKIRVEGKQAVLNRDAETRSVKALHGLSRSLINNMVVGVSKGFQKALEIQGVGFRAQVQGKNLNLNIGFSHPVIFRIPDGIKITVQENTKILIEGIDKQVVGQVAADIRSFYPPEPYKGKGIRYAGEQIRRKEGKTVQ
jgi:large subunit ribosomal protein L6